MMSFVSFYDFLTFSSVPCIDQYFLLYLLLFFLSVELCDKSVSFGIIQCRNSHTAQDKGLTNVGVWVSVGLNGET